MGDDSGLHPDLFDPFGSPVRDPRGRKRHKWNALVAEKVAVLRAAGMTVEAIATRFNVCHKTLGRVYSRELAEADHLVRAQHIEAMHEKAKAGSVPAAKFMREELGKGATERFERRAAEGARERRSPALGKKDQANADALTAGLGTEWGDDLVPPTVN